MNFNAKSPWVLVCGLLGATGVALGALAAHALSDPQAAISVERASNYQLLHTVVILVLLGYPGWTMLLARLIMFAGIVGFSGAIYAKYLLGLPALGALAPVGGSLLILSWFTVAAAWLASFTARSRDDR
ncbi:DUF423 domain-containing protein [Orrella daihaiensis]|uniref:DUF423 domain-containing protein n=1 Tax=Orrella daihaiensis TaxID=2782176 RepID=A0ABY4AGI1_9BURK|nr:DUF423 domain-containing protein [Orrella daihaiensis]UOD49393.1 DUF423 domain-containing protein [Orrella daihaiensis]